ncbi:hypothetical protein BV25DRAFT_1851055 [Artomyces pyxidatus]|uniref:Uncharacterized protein n=1 Tax=Artomyces pyxidatus TaxID=48021 RepID=A0ACB8TBL8_9AGAM|nr:hypothetical protein BV25DRAFT_1851055 [Artomyces pyxidatus]
MAEHSNNVETAGSIPFSFFISLLRKISRIKPTPAGTKASLYPYPALVIFRDWIKALDDKYAPLPPDTARIVFGFLFPENDVARIYNMQEAALAGALVKVLGVGQRGHKLTAWDDAGTRGCLGTEIFALLSETAGEDPDEDPVNFDGPSLTEVDALLTELASRSKWSDSSIFDASKSGRTRQQILRALYSPLRPRDAAFLTQILLKDLRPLLYPLAVTHTTAALLKYNSTAITALSKDHALRAWDQSGHLLARYRTLGDDGFVDGDDAQPRFGSRVEIPKCEKGHGGCKKALTRLGRAKKVWAETKYDGERAQIHVQVNGNGSIDIKIFSKSGRDSTLDRKDIHVIVKDALGLGLRRLEGRTPVKTAIVEAEMVAFDEERNLVDEFWRIRSLIDTTAVGVRSRRRKYQQQKASHLEDESQSSLISDASDDGARHLALVFFDVLMLNDASLLAEPYSERRATLESIIAPTPGYAMLAQRYPISLAGARGLRGAQEQLRAVFAAHIADFEEGLVLKADGSIYRDPDLPWIKLKRDYIPGYGDCIDLAIVGAAWEKERGRELRVAPTTVTTFYLGALSNAEEVKRNPKLKPHFEVYFTVSYGLNRKPLEETNWRIKSSDTLPYDPKAKNFPELPYTFNLFHGIPAPTILLYNPLLAEMYGAGFTKARSSEFYELRWPRLAKIHRPIERGWRESMSLQEVQRIAHEVVGRDSVDKDIEDCIRGIWGKPIREGIRSATRRRTALATWISNMEEADGIVKEADVPRTPKVAPADKGRTSNKGFKGGDGQAQPAQRLSAGYKAPSEAARPGLGLARLVSVTNVARLEQVAVLPSPPSSSPPVSPKKRRVSWDENTPSEIVPSSPFPSQRHVRTPTASRSPSSSPKKRRIESAFPMPLTTPPNTPTDANMTRVASASLGLTADQTLRLLTLSTSSPAAPSMPPTAPLLARPPAPRMRFAPTKPSRSEVAIAHVMSIFAESYVWLGRPAIYDRPHSQRPTATLVPEARQIHVLDAFLLGCGWGGAPPVGGDEVKRGIMLVDDGGRTSAGLGWTTTAEALALLEARAGAEGALPAGVRKPIWVVRMQVLDYGDVEKRRGRFDEYVIARIE